MTSKTLSLANYPTDQVRSSRVVANNTFELIGPLGDRTIRLHFTDIVIFRPDGSIVLDSGGWQTYTTKDRMRRFLPNEYRLWQEKGLWYVSFRPDGFVDYDSGAWTVPYYDGMVIPADGTAPAPDKGDHVQKELYKKQINQMCRKAKQLQKEGNLPKPSAGDCWLCMMEKTDEMRKAGGDPLTGNDHIISHLEEQYLHGSLIVAAFLWAGYSARQLPFVYDSWNTVNVLRRYLKARVGLPQ